VTPNRLAPHRTIALALFLALASSLFGATLAAAPEAPVQAINATEMRKHLSFLSSPELGGRYTLAPNFKIAARYLASRLESYGYKGAAKDGSFFQRFDVVTGHLDLAQSNLTLRLNGKELTVQPGQYYSSGTQNGKASGNLVFVGYGISSPAHHYDDYAGIDVKGKIVVMAYGTPKQVDPREIGDDEDGEPAALAHGASAVIILPPSRYLRSWRTPRGAAYFSNRKFTRLAASEKPGIPSLTVGPDAVQAILTALGTTEDDFYKDTAAGAPLKARDLDGSADLNVVMEKTVTGTQNVVGTLEGTDPKLKSEYVVFSAHYDHLETNAKGEIYPGADDDGSGTSAVLNIAKAMSMEPPRRSVLIIFHAGEELGLLGSRYNTDFDPVVPLDKVAVDLNIDMIGRSRPQGDTQAADEHLTGPDTIYLVGADRISPELNQISERTNADYQKLKIDYYYNDPRNPERIYFRSDHWNYAKHGIPVIFYFDGTHVDYHQPTDTIDKIDFNKMTRVARLVYETGWRVANLPHDLEKVEAKAAAGGGGASAN
jgi:hypothetical protein